MRDDLGKGLPLIKDERMDQTARCTSTSQINADEYEDWEEFLKDGKDVLHVTLSSGISGSYNSAVIARDTLKEKFRTAPSRGGRPGGSSGYGLLMDKLA